MPGLIDITGQRFGHTTALTEKEAEIADLKSCVVAFLAPWAAQYAEDFGLPKGHLHPLHYDLLARCGARMDDFTRAEEHAHD